MNYTLLPQDSSLSIKEQIFKNRDVQNYSIYDSASKKDIIHWSNLGQNINIAFDIIMQHKREGNGIGILSDSDF